METAHGEVSRRECGKRVWHAPSRGVKETSSQRAKATSEDSRVVMSGCVVPMGFGAVKNMPLVRTQEPKDCAWSWACAGGRRVEVCFLTLYQRQEAESLQQPREEAFAKAEAVLCYTPNKPLDQNVIQNTVRCESKE